MLREIKQCQITPGCTNMCEGSTDGCASCNKALRKANKLADKQDQKREAMFNAPEIPKVSPKMAAALRIYSQKRGPWLVGKQCAVFPEQKATQVHHKKGRGFGFADAWAKEHDICLLNDERYWLAVSADGHDKINNNTEWALEMGFSVLRLKKE